tara:strand:- start:2521 stop:4395 length:1875 start_codon:yes stop_codon:yes gene_type:complete
MPLIGNPYVIGDTTGNFKLLDDVSSYTLAFNPALALSIGADTITVNDHRFITGQRVVYNNGGGSSIGGLTSGDAYFIINNSLNTIKLAANYNDSLSGNSINLTAGGVGANHTLNLGFDGFNKKFRATFDNGRKSRATSAAQVLITINGVLQKPHQAVVPSEGFALEHPSVILFATAPASTDIFWGNIIANNFPTYDVTDHKIDNFVGNGSLTDFNLSKIPANSQSILVSLDGVIQTPTDATTTRDYEVIGNTLVFVNPPGNTVKIQVRHLGFVGAVSSDVTGFYGRTGNVALNNTDNIEVLTAKIGTGTTFTEDLVVQGDARVTGILTIGTGTIVLDGDNNNINVGTALTLSHTNGVLVGSSNLHTTGLGVQNFNVSGISTFSGPVNLNGSLNVNGIFDSDVVFAKNVSIGGTLTYEDVTNIDAVGVITARSDVSVGGNFSSVGITTLASSGGITTTGGDFFVGGNVSVAGTVTALEYRKSDGSEVSGSIGIQSAGLLVGSAVTTLNFIGVGNTFKFHESTKTLDVSISGGGGGSISISTTAPEEPASGDLWYSPDYGRIFIYYDESEVGYGNDAQWIDAAPFNMPPPDSRSLTIGRRTGAKVISVVGIGLSIFTRTGIGTASF